MDDFSRFTWIIVLHSKNEVSNMLIHFAKKNQIKLNHKIVGIMSNYGTKFENSKVDSFCSEEVFIIMFQLQGPHKKIKLWKGKIKLLNVD